MKSMPDRVAIVLTLVSVLSACGIVAVPGLSGFGTAVGILLALLPVAWAALFRRPVAADHPSVQTMVQQLLQKQTELNEQRLALEQIRGAVQAELERRAEELGQREQHLASRFARFHEFLEYPDEDLHSEQSADQLRRLGEQDREVRKLLEAEAERVYEKIRANGYTVNGQPDLLLIRDEVLSLIQRVARIYRPDSAAPLMETSLEQLARAASRIWLHLLVLLEQLPLGVQQYSIGTLYSYIRRAVIGYGVYQKASPWLTYAARGIYAGRIVAAANPAALGAWWLATELGKQGAKKLMEQTLDRQAVSLLQQLVTVIGVEAAGIYGTGFRQRDPAWILGAELVELIAAFPASGDSLRHGLRKVTALPLLSEYDRIYLYRCLADHRSAGLQLSEPAMLTREQREKIIGELEQFFAAHIHGMTDATVRTWREGVETRFDLRLRLDASVHVVSSSRSEQLQDAAASLYGFLTLLVRPEPENVRAILGSLRIVGRMTEAQRTQLTASLPGLGTSVFEPPLLDPASELTELYLKDLATCAVAAVEPVDETEQLVVEAGSYFRRPEHEIRKWLDEAWRQKLRWESTDETLSQECEVGLARLFFVHRKPGERPVFRYGNLLRVVDGRVEPLSEAWLLGYQSTDRLRLIVVRAESDEVLWTAASPLRIDRIPGVFLDDARLSGGEWTEPVSTKKEASELQIQGNLRGGRYSGYFGRLLRWV